MPGCVWSLHTYVVDYRRPTHSPPLNYTPDRSLHRLPPCLHVRSHHARMSLEGGRGCDGCRARESILCVHIGVNMCLHTPTSCATTYFTWSKYLFVQATRPAMPCGCATHTHTRAHARTHARTQERDADKITPSPASSAHAQARTVWTQTMLQQPSRMLGRQKG
jgi:hypothetical protein